MYYRAINTLKGTNRMDLSGGIIRTTFLTRRSGARATNGNNANY